MTAQLQHWMRQQPSSSIHTRLRRIASQIFDHHSISGPRRRWPLARHSGCDCREWLVDHGNPGPQPRCGRLLWPWQRIGDCRRDIYLRQEGAFLFLNARTLPSLGILRHVAVPLGMPCYALIWEGDIGDFYEVDERLQVAHLGRVITAPGSKYALLYALADQNSPFPKDTCASNTPAR